MSWYINNSESVCLVLSISCQFFMYTCIATNCNSHRCVSSISCFNLSELLIRLLLSAQLVVIFHFFMSYIYCFSEYLRHVSFLDRGIQQAVKQFEDFFDNDGKTTYVFTSDHGMNNWGGYTM